MKKIIVGVVALLILAGGALVAYRQGWLGVGDKKLYNLVKNNQEYLDLYNKAKEKELAIAQKPDNASLYVDAGLYWKSIAERIGAPNNKIFFKRSLQVYEQGIEKFGKGNILFYHNGGALAEHLNDFAKSESYYRQEIAISPNDEMGYIDLFQLYDFKLHKSKEEALPILDSGIKTLLNPASLVSVRATYLRRVGDYKNALSDYELLSKNYPTNQGYKDIIAELKAKLSNTP